MGDRVPPEPRVGLVSRRAAEGRPGKADPPKNDEEGTIDWSAEVARKKAQGLIPDGK